MEIESLEDKNNVYLGTEPLPGPSNSSEASISSPPAEAPYVFITAENSSTVIRRVVSASSLQNKTIPSHNVLSVFRRSPSVTIPEREVIPSTVEDASDDDVVILSEYNPKNPRGKKRKKVTKKAKNVSNRQACSICLDDWGNVGAHRISCLECGHLFGESCIRWWLMTADAPFGHCPQCNAKARLSDIRPLFARALRALNATERNRLLAQLELVSDQNSAQKQMSLLHIFYRRYGKDLKKFVKNLPKDGGEMSDVAGSSLSRSNEQLVDENTDPVKLEGIGENGTSCQFSLITTTEVARDGGSRLMDYFAPKNLLAVSQRSEYQFFCGYGVKVVDTEEMRATQFLPAHLRKVKDTAFGRTSTSHRLLLSVSYDCTACLLDVVGNSNPIVATISTGTPLYSCCWDAINRNLIHVGSQTGVILSFDIRRTSRPVFRRVDPADNSPIISLISIPPSPGRSMPRGGLISCHASNCWAHDYVSSEIRRISLEGPFTNVRYESTTQHFLLSAKASRKNPDARFTVCMRASRKNLTERDWRRGGSSICNAPVQTFVGNSERKLHSRPCITPIEKDLVVAAYQESSSTVALWSVGSGNRVSTIPTSEAVVDSCFVKVNGIPHLVLLTEKNLSFYKYGNE